MPRRRTHRAATQPPGGQDLPAPPHRPYKVVSVSLYADQAEVIDQAAEELVRAGFGKMNRSLVVQTAIQRLKEDLAGKHGIDVVKYFMDQRTKRPLNVAPRRSTAAKGIGRVRGTRAVGE
jgi:hypothetical protein